MLFNSAIFIVFFIVVYFMYINLKRNGQNVLLLLASYVFYGWWDYRFLSLIVLSTLIDYMTGLKIENSSKPEAKKWLALSMVSNLGILAFFKYFNFFAESLQGAVQSVGYDLDPITLKIVLPVGISFYTFQTMSYTIDIYRGQLKPTRSLLNFAVFVSFFPQLVAGPIERAKKLLPQIEKDRVLNRIQIQEGLWLLLWGFFQKMVIADNMAIVANSVFNNPGEFGGAYVVLGVVAFAFQIYGDFSGYSDIARGLSKLMGVDLIENFKNPYFAKNPSEFWRRWHISLSQWLRDYLYIPLGGNLGGNFYLYRNLFLTMLLGGLWHGASWNFVVWGAFHGVILILQRLAGLNRPEKSFPKLTELKLGQWSSMLVMFLFTLIGWVLFRVNSLSDVPVILSSIFSGGKLPVGTALQMLVYLSPLLVVNALQEQFSNPYFLVKQKFIVKWGAFCLIYGMILLFGVTKSFEFIYFQF